MKKKGLQTDAILDAFWSAREGKKSMNFIGKTSISKKSLILYACRIRMRKTTFSQALKDPRSSHVEHQGASKGPHLWRIGFSPTRDACFEFATCKNLMKMKGGYPI